MNGFVFVVPYADYSTKRCSSSLSLDVEQIITYIIVLGVEECAAVSAKMISSVKQVQL